MSASQPPTRPGIARIEALNRLVVPAGVFIKIKA